MASTVTVADLKTQIRDMADIKHSTFVTDTELLSLINSAYADLYDMLVESTEDYYVQSATITTDGIADSFNLPTNFYKLNGVDYSISGTPEPMERFVFEDRHKYIYNTSIIRYRLIKNQIMFKPTPSAQTITVWYTPATTALTLDADTVDGVNGWEDWIILSVAISCFIKEESDPSALMIEKNGLEKRIQSMSRNRDQGKPERVTDVTGSRNPSFFLGDETWL